MKKAIALTLTAVFFLTGFFWLPQSSAAETQADVCYKSWDACRTRAFASDEGILRTTLLLTVCDLALGRCLLRI